MKTFKEIRENWDKDEEKAFANVLFYLAKTGTKASIITGRALIKAAKKTGDYIGKKIIAMMIPEADIKDLEALARMGVDLPFYAMTPRQQRAFEGTIEEGKWFKMPKPGLSAADSTKISAALKAGKTVIGKSDRKDGSNKGKDFKILKLYVNTIGISRVKKAYVDWGTGKKPMDRSFITSYSIRENEVSKKD